MAKIKHTKTELKAQREALRRFDRFLPMLQLKKQQLQIEIHNIDTQIEHKNEAERQARESLEPWIKLFSEDVGIEDLLNISTVRYQVGNIAGVNIPVLEDVVFAAAEPDLARTPPWVDDGLDMLKTLLRLRVERALLETQRRLIAEELRVTSQRVNLFEKVKIPETRENIRVIKIFLGDEQTAGVARAKNTKKRLLQRVA